VDKKSLLSAFLITILICALALLSATRFGAVQAATEVIGVIYSDTTWTQAGSPYTLTGNLLVENGVKLTINAGTTVNLGSCYMMVNGTLVARGTSDNPIVFNGGSITFTSSIAAWNEQTQTGCIIENAILTTTITSKNAVKISSNTINSALTVTSDSIVVNNIINGDVRGGKISGNIITGDVSGKEVSSNNIIGNVGSGRVSNNYIKGQIGAGGDCLITNNTIIGDMTHSEAAIQVGPAYLAGGTGHPKIKNNIIANNSIGIRVTVLIREWYAANIPEIRNNLIIQNGVGIQYSISRQETWEKNQTIIESNTIAGNEIGIKFLSTAKECQVINNNIEEYTAYCIYLQDVRYEDVTVTNNWWGTTDQSAIANSFYDYHEDFDLGKVNFVPFLTAPNPDAPAKLGLIPTPPPTDSPSPATTLTPTPTTTPHQEPQQIEQEVIIGAAITVAVLGAGLGLLVYLIRRK